MLGWYTKCVLTLLFFTRFCIEGNDNHPIRIRYFGVFTQKYILNKERMLDSIYHKLLKEDKSLVSDMLEVLFGDKFSIDEVDKKLEDLYISKDLKSLNKLYKPLNKNRE